MTKSAPPPLGAPKELLAHRYIELDSLRGLAALTVVLHHFLLVFGGSPWYWPVELSPIRVLIAGHEAVALFFVLSGFVLSVPYSGRNPPSYPEFLAKRFCRIYLPYISAGLIAMALAVRLYSTAHTGSSWLDNTWSKQPTMQMLRGLLMVRGHGIEQINGAFWSIVVEIHISLIFPILYFLCRRFRLAAVAISILVLHVAFAFLPPNLAPALLAPLHASCFFVMGIFLERNLKRISQFVDGISPTLKTALVLIVIAMFEVPGAIVQAAHFDDTGLVATMANYIVGAGASGIILFCMRDNKVKQVLRGRVLLRLGALSYSTYLIHGTVLFVLIRTLYGRFPFGYLFPVYIALVYVGSEIFYLVVDKTAVNLGRRVARVFRRKPAPIALNA